MFPMEQSPGLPDLANPTGGAPDVAGPPRSAEPDPSSPVERLPDTPQTELTSLWRHALSSYPNGVPRGELRDVAKRVSADARAAGLRSEELVVAIKASWAAHHDDAHPARGRKLLQPLVSELITVCIEEFYRENRTP